MYEIQPTKVIGHQLGIVYVPLFDPKRSFYFPQSRHITKM